jgi:hypothetical protein
MVNNEKIAKNGVLYFILEGGGDPKIHHKLFQTKKFHK